MNAKELLLWVIGMQHCSKGLPARSEHQDYLAGYATKTCLIGGPAV